HTRFSRDWSSDVCSSDLPEGSDTCYISDHTDIAMGANPASPNLDAALTFLEWMTSQEFAELYTNQLPGFFTLSNHDIEVEDPLRSEERRVGKECRTRWWA